MLTSWSKMGALVYHHSKPQDGEGEEGNYIYSLTKGAPKLNTKLLSIQFIGQDESCPKVGW